MLGKLFFQFFEPRITRTARIPENAQPGPFDPGCAGRAINYLLSANVTAGALASDEASVLAVFAA
jgi:hypothetical protein